MNEREGSRNSRTRSFADSYWMFHGPRLLLCPETGTVVDLELDAVHAMLTSLAGDTELRVARCRLWEECVGWECDQMCLRGLDPAFAAEHGLLVRCRKDGDR